MILAEKFLKMPYFKERSDTLIQRRENQSLTLYSFGIKGTHFQ